MSVDPDLPESHFDNVVFGVLRFWLALLIVGMISTASSARSILLDDNLRPVPYMLVALAAAIWWWKPTSGRVTRWCDATIVGLLAFRVMELAVFSKPGFGRLTPSMLWVMIAGGWAGIGYLTAHLIGRRQAERLLMGGRE